MKAKEKELLYGWNFNAWFYFKSVDICVCAPQKNGCTSLFRAVHPKSKSNLQFRKYAFVNGVGPFTPAEIMELYPSKEKLLMVREPVARFASLWRDKAFHKKSVDMSEIKGMSPQKLIDHIMYNPLGNYHWYPQYMYMVPKTKPIPFYDVFHYLNLSDKHENSSGDRGEDPKMPEKLILQHYHQDALLWEQALRNARVKSN